MMVDDLKGEPQICFIAKYGSFMAQTYIDDNSTIGPQEKFLLLFEQWLPQRLFMIGIDISRKSHVKQFYNFTRLELVYFKRVVDP